jgi:tRNA-Thr(GGU) m(6)t(6)A37 methyltransferase TsaA
MKIIFTPIGIIHTPHKTKEGMPIQSSNAEGIKGFIKLKKKHIKGLLDLDGFSHIYLIYHFHKSKGFELLVKPFLDDSPHGVFSTRAPKRPNSIGISVVKLISIKDNILEIENVDMMDGTPLLDIKPYISEFDIHNNVKVGWIKGKKGLINEMKSDDRFK